MPCHKLRYKEFCSQVNNYLPCCDTKERVRAHHQPLFLRTIDTPGVMLQLFEFKETMIRRNIVKFYAKGICMYPAVRPGDILHLECKKIDDIKVGDIAVYRRNNNLFGHRVINKGCQEGAAYLIVSPDNSGDGSEGPIFSDDIAGVIVNIERKRSSRVNVEFIILMKIKKFLSKNFIYPMAFMQSSLLYKQIAKILSLKIKKDLTFSITMPLKGNINSRFRRVVSSDEVFNFNRDENLLLEWTLVLNISRRPVASLSFVRHPKDCCFSGWWISQGKIMNLYRGSIIEEEIFKKSEELLSALGAQDVSVSIAKNDYLNRMIFGGLGFKAKRSNDRPNPDFSVLERKVKK
ncbi:MAG: hypothetical protein WC469_00205 [Candidatus Omnitrophota bacterium]